MRSICILSKAWFYKSAISEAELVAAVSKAASMPYVKQPQNLNSLNRLVMTSSDDYAHPDFLADTIGARSNYCILSVKIERWSLTFENLRCYKSLIEEFAGDEKNNKCLDSFDGTSLKAELFFNKAPIILEFFYFLKTKTSELRIFPFGKCVGGADSGMHLRGENSISKAARNRAEKFLSKLGITTFNHVQFEGKTADIIFSFDELIDFINKLLLVKFLDNGASSIGLHTPITSEVKSIKYFIDRLFDFGTNDFEIYFLPWFNNSFTCGFTSNDVNCYHDDIGLLCDRTPFIQEYSCGHELFLRKYVTWLNKISNLGTMSGNRSCYALLQHCNDSCSLVVFPYKGKFVIAIVPFDSNSKLTSDLDLFSIIGSKDDWLEGIIPEDQEYFPPSETTKSDRYVGEFDLPQLPPYEFTNTDVYIKKAIHRLENQKPSQKKAKAIDECSLEEQLKKMVEAGLVLSPGITAEDFLMTESEESYRAEPYSHLCWQLTNRNEKGRTFCPLAFNFADYDIPEKELMREFQRICGFLSITIENIESEDYEEGQGQGQGDEEDEEEPEGLKHIRFTANGEKVIWNFGPDPSFNKRYEWLDHAQEFFRQRFADLLIYEISGVYRMLCLSSEAAKEINNLIRVSVVK